MSNNAEKLYKLIANDSKKKQSLFLILCDVACGLEQEKKSAEFMTSADPPYHCVKSLGRFEPSKTVPIAQESPSLLSTGPLLDQHDDLPEDLKFNEYHIYDVGQVRMKYLVELTLS